jgi:hypothetical protein
LTLLVPGDDPFPLPALRRVADDSQEHAAPLLAGDDRAVVLQARCSRERAGPGKNRK